MVKVRIELEDGTVKEMEGTFYLGGLIQEDGVNGSIVGNASPKEMCSLIGSLVKGKQEAADESNAGRIYFLGKVLGAVAEMCADVLDGAMTESILEGIPDENED